MLSSALKRWSEDSAANDSDPISHPHHTTSPNVHHHQPNNISEDGLHGVSHQAMNSDPSVQIFATEHGDQYATPIALQSMDDENFPDRTEHPRAYKRQQRYHGMQGLPARATTHGTKAPEVISLLDDEPSVPKSVIESGKQHGLPTGFQSIDSIQDENRPPASEWREPERPNKRSRTEYEPAHFPGRTAAQCSKGPVDIINLVDDDPSVPYTSPHGPVGPAPYHNPYADSSPAPYCNPPGIAGTAPFNFGYANPGVFYPNTTAYGTPYEHPHYHAPPHGYNSHQTPDYQLHPSDRSANSGFTHYQNQASAPLSPPPSKITPKTQPAPRGAAAKALQSLSEDLVQTAEPVLCAEQERLVELIMSGRNVFYTGSAGCGKSTVLKVFVRRCEEKGLKVNIIAPTGRAALDVNGSTTWTYAGWTPDSHKKPLEELMKAAHGKFVSQRLNDTDVLVIDEISMVENLHLERLNAVMKEARGKKTAAFGGVQLVVTGDFCQLPPVKPFRHCIDCGRELQPNKESTEYKCALHGVFYDKDKWAFRSQAWKESNFEHVNLSQIHRQSDSVFIGMLQKLRMGQWLLPAEVDLLLNHESKTHNAVKLFSTREEVKRVNSEQFNKLKSKARPFKCLDYFKWNEKHRNLQSKSLRGPDGSLNSLRDHRFDPQIQLKQGMLVVLLANLDISSGLVNGSQGVITGWEKYSKSKMPKAAKINSNGRVILPDISSEVPVLGGEYGLFREHRIQEFIEAAERQEWPIVRFVNGVTRTIYADCTVNELGDDQPYSLLSRAQIPLMAAWAMTTHKSQGMTLNRVIVDLAKSFEQGQAYVALSRARSLDGLKVISFPKSAQGSGNSEVKEFLKEKFGIE